MKAKKAKVMTDINICKTDVHFFVQVKGRRWNKDTNNVKMVEINMNIMY